MLKDERIPREIQEKLGFKGYKELIYKIVNGKVMLYAEGVETLEELNFIKEVGVDFVQGYYTGRPISEIEFQNI